MCLRDRHMRRVDPSPHVLSHLEDPLSWSNSSSTISSIPLVLGGGQLRCFLRTGRMEGQVGTRALVLLGVLVLSALQACYAGETSRYVRRLAESEDLPLDSPYFAIPPGYNAPQQVHITQGDHVGEAVIVSWITPSKPGKSVVYYGKSKGDYTDKAKGKYTWYTYYNYTSGYIHHVTIRNLEYSSRYYYKIGEGSSAREFWFDTPPKVDPDTPYVFGVMGDLGQTYDSASTLEHYLQSDGKAVLFVGDLSYADNYEFDDGRRWDTWGRFVERSTAYQPWIWTAGNHEIEFNPSYGESKPYKPYSHRFKVPFKDSGSVSNLWYSIKRASAHIIVLSSYSAYAKYSPQYKWLETELQNVDRTVSPWLVVLLHSPWYNSNTYHYFEGESMRVQFEPWFVKYKVDIVFAGHVHAYERSKRISNVKYNITNGLCTPVPDESAPIYVTIGDGGNKEGLASNFTYPQPDYSAFREASFGHAIFEIKNKTHAFYSWHRNQDGEAVFADSSWLINRYWALHDAT